MAGINEFLIFDENNQNTLSNESYSIDTQRLNGVGGGLARSSLYNKSIRQATIIGNAIGQIISENGYNAKEDASLKDNLQNGLMRSDNVKIPNDFVSQLGGSDVNEVLEKLNKNYNDFAKTVMKRKLIKSTKINIDEDCYYLNEQVANLIENIDIQEFNKYINLEFEVIGEAEFETTRSNSQVYVKLCIGRELNDEPYSTDKCMLMNFYLDSTQSKNRKYKFNDRKFYYINKEINLNYNHVDNIPEHVNFSSLVTSYDNFEVWNGNKILLQFRTPRSTPGEYKFNINFTVNIYSYYV